MTNTLPDAIDVDQLRAFVELARCGSLRRAAESLLISEQGLRSRLLVLEAQLHAELYRKQRGRRTTSPLTAQGKMLLPHAIDFLQRAERLATLFRDRDEPREIHVVASQYLIAYVLLDAVRRFQKRFPNIRVRLSARSEGEIEQALRDNVEIAFGVAAPYEASPELAYHHLFAMPWSVIGPLDHGLLRKRKLLLEQVVHYPLILFERGSTGRQHVMEALHSRGLQPDIALEATNTDLIVRMVEARLGIAIVPLLPSGVVTRGHAVSARSLGDQIRPIQSGVLSRRGEKLSSEAEMFRQFIQSTWRGKKQHVDRR